jgi:hypothetical protein
VHRQLPGEDLGEGDHAHLGHAVGRHRRRRGRRANTDPGGPASRRGRGGRSAPRAGDRRAWGPAGPTSRPCCPASWTGRARARPARRPPRS